MLHTILKKQKKTIRIKTQKAMQEPDCLQNAFENHGLEGLTAEYAQKHIASGKQPVRYMTV